MLLNGVKPIHAQLVGAQLGSAILKCGQAGLIEIEHATTPFGCNVIAGCRPRESHRLMCDGTDRMLPAVLFVEVRK